MVGEQHLPFVLYAVCTTVLLAQGSQGTVKYLLIEMFLKYAFEYANIWGGARAQGKTGVSYGTVFKTIALKTF